MASHQFQVIFISYSHQYVTDKQMHREIYLILSNINGQSKQVCTQFQEYTPLSNICPYLFEKIVKPSPEIEIGKKILSSKSNSRAVQTILQGKYNRSCINLGDPKQLISKGHASIQQYHWRIHIISETFNRFDQSSKCYADFI